MTSDLIQDTPAGEPGLQVNTSRSEARVDLDVALAKTDTTSNSFITVSPAAYEDLESIVTCELLAFPGLESRVGAHMHPFRAALFKAGLHPKYWPDYAPTIRKRARKLISGSELFKATIVEGGKTVVVGMAWFSPAAVMMKTKRTWNQRLLDKFLYPAIETVRSYVWADNDGTNEEFLNLFKTEVIRARQEYQKEHGDCCTLELLAIHPDYKRRGIGTALMKHCTEIANSSKLPVYLESTQAGIPLYRSLGFNFVRDCTISYKGESIDWPVMVREPTS